MNNTKWDELRLAMYELGDLSPRFRTCCVENSYVSPWDGEWYYHLRECGYEILKWVEIEVVSTPQRELVLSRLRDIHGPGESSEHGFRVFGYAPRGEPVEYL